MRLVRDRCRALTILGDCMVRWEELAASIYYAPIRTNPAELLVGLFDFGVDAAMLDPGIRRELLIGVFLDAWAVLPHRAYGGQTPEEAGERLPIIDPNDPLFD
ncbi:hypothetical protein BLEM_1770 [Bifidobacterium lemurum]|uniref:Uncharacterized protein n=2 Tax=Bifidobacterium lemurum TaxID=1603886 RepID=A0A261FN40_9BIFI|nr:hypothetical protein BLEM_1770 [Bifidobacterium lemurum]